MLSQAKILLIEDDMYIRDIYEETLKEAGYHVTTAIDGQEGLLKASEGGYNLVLLDMMMPKMDGIGVLTELKQKPPKIANGAIILLTNLAHESVINQAKSLGAKNFLVKSDLNPDQLVEKVKGFLA